MQRNAEGRLDGGSPAGGSAKVDRLDAIRTLEAILAPHIGPYMARASVRAHCKQLGIAEVAAVEPTQIEGLIGRLGLGLAVLVGRDRAQEVAAAMRSAMSGGLR